MLVTDLTLRFDPEFEKFPVASWNDPRRLSTKPSPARVQTDHRDMGPKSRCYLGPEVPSSLIWQDPLPEAVFNPTKEDIDKA